MPEYFLNSPEKRIHDTQLSGPNLHNLESAADKQSIEPAAEAVKIMHLAEDRFKVSKTENDIGASSCALAKEWQSLKQEDRNAVWESLTHVDLDKTMFSAMGLGGTAIREQGADGKINVTGIIFENGFLADPALNGKLIDKKTIVAVTKDGTEVGERAHFWSRTTWKTESDGT